jgi:hypothetical protein
MVCPLSTRRASSFANGRSSTNTDTCGRRVARLFDSSESVLSNRSAMDVTLALDVDVLQCFDGVHCE